MDDDMDAVFTKLSGSHRSGVHPPAKGCLVMDLPFSPLAADAARTASAAALTGAGAACLVDEARLVSSELATNALRSGRPPLMLTVGWTMRPAGGFEVEITVTDGGCGRAAERRTRAVLPGDDAEEGRGLAIVQALACAWSLDIGADTTRAWCLLRGAGAGRRGAAPAIRGGTL